MTNTIQKIKSISNKAYNDTLNLRCFHKTMTTGEIEIALDTIKLKITRIQVLLDNL